jgi:hypothetical protein
MSPQSTAFSLLAIASIFSSSIALPLEALNIVPRQAYSIVNVDGSSSPTSEPAPQVVIQTVTDVETAALPTSTFIATVNVDRGSATETIYLTVTPTPTPASTPEPTPAPQPAVIVLPPPVIPYYPLHLNSTSSSTSTSETSTISLSTATSSKLCDETPEPTPEPTGDGAPWRQSYNPFTTGTGTAYPTAAYPTAAYTTGGYNAPVAARPSGMTEPLPVLPPAAPYWFNTTEIPNVRRRVVVSEE